MTLAKPKFVLFDTSTLANVTRDHFDESPLKRQKAMDFIAALFDQNVHIILTFTHLYELLRHENDEVVSNRLAFLRHLPLVAWLRPYNRNWLPGNITDLLLLELHKLVYHSSNSWSEIIDSVREDLWETATGKELFIEGLPIWDLIRRGGMELQKLEIDTSSITRCDIFSTKKLTLREIYKRRIRNPIQTPKLLGAFRRAMQNQLETHGDDRIEGTKAIANQFTNSLSADLIDIESSQDHPAITIM